MEEKYPNDHSDIQDACECEWDLSAQFCDGSSSKIKPLTSLYGQRDEDKQIPFKVSPM